MLLDRVQKKKLISRDDHQALKQGWVGGGLSVPESCRGCARCRYDRPKSTANQRPGVWILSITEI